MSCSFPRSTAGPTAPDALGVVLARSVHRRSMLQRYDTATLDASGLASPPTFADQNSKPAIRQLPPTHPGVTVRFGHESRMDHSGAIEALRRVSERSPAPLSGRHQVVRGASTAVIALQRARGSGGAARLLQRSPDVPDFDDMAETTSEYRTERVGDEAVRRRVLVHLYRRIDADEQNLFWLDDWLQRARARDPVTVRIFDPGRNPRGIPVDLSALVAEVKKKRDSLALPAEADPRNRIAAFERADGELVFNVRREHVAEHLRTVIRLPERLAQGRYPLCGPDAFLRAWLRMNPGAYVDYVISLVQTGHGRLGHLVVRAPVEVRRKAFAQAQRHDLEGGAFAAMAALRSQENFPLYTKIRHTPRMGEHPLRVAGITLPIWVGYPSHVIRWMHAGIAGGSDVSDLADWFRRAGVPPDKMEFKEKRASLVTQMLPFTYSDFGRHWRRIHELYLKRWQVLLAIHQDVIGNSGELSRFAVGGHFVTLDSPLEREDKDGRWGIRFAALTWGGRRDGWFLREEKAQALIGYLAVDPSALPAEDTTAERAMVLEADVGEADVRSAIDASRKGTEPAAAPAGRLILE